MLVASSNVSPDFFGAATKRKNSRDLVHRYFRRRQVMSFNPLVDQFAIDVKTAACLAARFVFQRSVTIGCRVACHLNPCVGTPYTTLSPSPASGATAASRASSST